jgi:phosphoglycolate phosphatase
MTNAPKLLLFDIDGTLLLTGRAGLRAMVRAFRDLFGRDDPFAGVAMAGRTDTFLLSEALGAAGLTDDEPTHARFRERYLQLLAEEIERPGTGHKGVMPGVRPLLEALVAQDEEKGQGALNGSRCDLALLTGNYREAARIKLTYFGLWDFFRWGVFGDESPDRNALARLARDRAAAAQAPVSAADIVVIGDTPFDIECAKAIGARAVGVGTGGHSTSELRKMGADVVFEDLSDTEAVLNALL